MAGRDIVRKFKVDRIHLLKRMTLEEREIQTLSAALAAASFRTAQAKVLT